MWSGNLPEVLPLAKTPPRVESHRWRDSNGLALAVCRTDIPDKADGVE